MANEITQLLMSIAEEVAVHSDEAADVEAEVLVTKVSIARRPGRPTDTSQYSARFVLDGDVQKKLIGFKRAVSAIEDADDDDLLDALLSRRSAVSDVRLQAIHDTQEAIEEAEETYGSFTSADIGKARSTGSRPGAYATNLRAKKAILGVDVAGELRFPAFQFDPETLEPLAAMKDILAELQGSGWTDVSILLWLTGPSGRLGGRAPADVLRTEPGTVIEMARGQASGW